MKKADNKNNENRSILKRCGQKSNTDLGSVDVSTDFLNRIIHEKKGSGDFKEDENRETYDHDKVAQTINVNKNKKKNLHVSFCDEIIKGDKTQDNGLIDSDFLADEDNCFLKSNEDTFVEFSCYNFEKLLDKGQDVDNQPSVCESDSKVIFGLFDELKTEKKACRYSEPFRFTAEDTTSEKRRKSFNGNPWKKKPYGKHNLKEVFEFTEDVLEQYNDYNPANAEKSPDKIGRFTLIAVNVEDVLKTDSKANSADEQEQMSHFEKELSSDMYKEVEYDYKKKVSHYEDEMGKSSEGDTLTSPSISNGNMSDLYFGIKDDSSDCRDGIFEEKYSINQSISSNSKISEITGEERAIDAKRAFLCNLYGISDDDSSRIDRTCGGSMKDFDYDLSTNVDWCSDYLESSSSQGLDLVDVNDAETSKVDSLEDCVNELLNEIRAFDKAKVNKLCNECVDTENVIAISSERRDDEISLTHLKNDMLSNSDISTVNTNFEMKAALCNDEFDSASNFELTNTCVPSNTSLSRNGSDGAINVSPQQYYSTAPDSDENPSNTLLYEPVSSSSFVKVEQNLEQVDNVIQQAESSNSKDNLKFKEVMNGSFNYPIKKTKSNSWFDIKNNSIWIPWKEIFPVHKAHLHYPYRGIWWTSVPLVYYSRHIADT